MTFFFKQQQNNYTYLNCIKLIYLKIFALINDHVKTSKSSQFSKQYFLLQPTWLVRPPNSCAWMVNAFQKDGVAMAISTALTDPTRTPVPSKQSDPLAPRESSCALRGTASTHLGNVMATRIALTDLTKPIVSWINCNCFVLKTITVTSCERCYKT